MARVTIEDCSDKIDSRFKLVVLASQRAKEIANGAPLLVDRDNDKNPVVALREIAQEHVDPEVLNEAIIKKHQKKQAIEIEDSPEDDVIAADQQEIAEEMQSLQSEDEGMAGKMSTMYQDEVAPEGGVEEV